MSDTEARAEAPPELAAPVEPPAEPASEAPAPESAGSGAGDALELRIAALRTRPTFAFFGVVASVSLAADIATKAWAEVVLSKRTLLDPSIVVVKDHLFFTLAYNKGGAWGLLQNASENVRRPFFLAVSVLAIAFIVSLYNKLNPDQRALKWGLPLVLGGALGNLSDRITRSSVIDFIDYRALWIEKLNAAVAKLQPSWSVTDHWPTFNVADIAICVGVGLMAVDMFTSRRGAAASAASPPKPA
jgi:signal peptidase II